MEKLDVYLLMASRILRSLVAGFLAVVIGLYFLKIGLADFQIGILFGIGAFATPLLSFIFSIYADKYSKKMFLLITLAFLPISIIILLTTRNFALLALSSALGGFGIAGGLVGGGVGAIVAPIQTAILAEKSKKEELTKIYSIFTTLSTYSGAFGALFANIGDYTELFMIGLILSLASFLVVIPIREEKSKKEDMKVDDKTKDDLATIRKKDLDVIKKFTYTGMFNGISQGLIIPFIPIIFEQFYKLTQAQIGDIVFIGGIASASIIWLTPVMNEKLGFVRFIIYTRLVSTILTLAFPFLRLPILASIDYIIFTSFRVFALPAQQALMMTLISGRRRATASGTNQTARLLPSALSTFLSGFLLSISVVFPFALAFVTNMTNLYLYYKFFWNVPEAREKRKISARVSSEG